jgi:6-phosphogluconate dehydrogenase
VVQSDITEHGPVENPGEWIAQLASEDTHCVTAVGLRSAGRFVSIVHRSSRPKTAV